VLKYLVTVRELPIDEGSGFLVEVPDLPGCMADGDTVEQALRNAEDAIGEWIDAAREMGRDISKPENQQKFSGKWVQRVPRSLHMRLAAAAKREGVSLNTYVAALLAEGLGRRSPSA
jgi:antitoxin HicB